MTEAPGGVLVCGSTALDLIGHYQGSFAAYQDNYAVDGLNISLQLDSLRTSFGGCGINIAYGLTKLGVDCYPLSAAGADFRDHYQQHLQTNGVNITHIVIDDAYARSSTGIMVGDDQGNQMTFFYAGASASRHRQLPSELPMINRCQFAVLAPETADIMLRQARDLDQLGIPIIFDPGQCLAGFSRDQVTELLGLAKYTMLNSHEFDILLKIADIDRNELVRLNHQVIVTRSELGVDVFTASEDFHVEALPVGKTLYPTGCGDAFRAGYVFGLTEGFTPVICARLGCLMAAHNLASPESQTYQINRDLLLRHYAANFGELSGTQGI